MLRREKPANGNELVMAALILCNLRTGPRSLHQELGTAEQTLRANDRRVDLNSQLHAIGPPAESYPANPGISRPSLSFL
jgi:hypothetical protein